MPDSMPVEVFPPGEFLREELEERGWSQTDLADILGVSFPTVNQIIMGKRGISPEMAHGLAAAFGTSPDVWMNLDQAYQLWRRQTDTSPVAKRARLYDFAPIKDMVSRGWLPKTESVEVLEHSVLRFYGVSSLDADLQLMVAARKSTSYEEPLTSAQKAWVVRAKGLARTLQVPTFSPTSVGCVVDALKPLMREPREARHVPRILAEAGIRFVVVAPLPGVKIDGACIWVGKQPIIAMSLRFDRIDNFWFTLLHELDHVAKNASSLDCDLGISSTGNGRPAYELEADAFAEDTLLKPDSIESFIARKRPLYSQRDVEAFAAMQHVHPGIVVGRLHKREELQWSHLRKLLVPIRDVVAAASLADGWGHVAPAGI